MGIARDTKEYESWLAGHTPLVAADLAKKHAEMAAGAFPFLRATFYRWMRRWPKLCPQVADAPAVLAVGDLHVENFGTWRDGQGRLAWGINDFDEAYHLAYTIDLVRLATSALMAIKIDHLSVGREAACEAILSGYRDSLTRGGHPIVIDESHRWLVTPIEQGARDPVRFWQKMRDLPPVRKEISKGAMRAIRSVLPEDDLPLRLARRVAGLGSLGKPRFVALAEWQGGPIAREAKAITPSACMWAAERSKCRIYYADITDSAVRCPDPLLCVRGNWLGRRLAPDCGRVELASLPRIRQDIHLLHSMGWETGNVHLGSCKAMKDVRRDLGRRRGNWLYSAALEMENSVMTDWQVWKERWSRGHARE